MMLLPIQSVSRCRRRRRGGCRCFGSKERAQDCHFCGSNTGRFITVMFETLMTHDPFFESPTEIKSSGRRQR